MNKIKFLLNVIIISMLIFISCSPFADNISDDNDRTSDPPVNSNNHTSIIPSLVWNGCDNQYAIAWVDYRDGNSEIYFARIDKDGKKIGSDVRITNAPQDSHDPTLVWTGTDYGLTWRGSRYEDEIIYEEIYFARIYIDKETNETKISKEMRITDAVNGNSYMPSLIWNNVTLEFGIAWFNSRDGILNCEIYFSRIYVDKDTNETKISKEVNVSNASGNSLYPSLACLNGNYGIAWHDLRHDSMDDKNNSEIYFAKLDGSGNKMGNEIRITSAPNSSLLPSLTAADNKWGIIWKDNREDKNTYEMYFTQLEDNGTKGNDLKITNVISISSILLVWNQEKNEYGVIWQDHRNIDPGGDIEIYFTRLFESENEIKTSTEILITNNSSSSNSLVWTGDRYGIAFTNDNEIYFTIIVPSGEKIINDIQISDD